MSAYIQGELTSLVTSQYKIRVVTRKNMEKIDKELDYQLSGYVSDETALSICKRLGAEVIVFGTLSELENKYNLQVKMLDVESATYRLFKTYTFSRSSKSEQLMGRSASWYKASLGLVIDVNKNSVSYISPAVGIYFDYNIFRKFTLGIKALVSYDAFNRENSIYSFEPLAFAKFYLVNPSGEPSTGLFVAIDVGGTVVFIDNDTKGSFNIGGSLGYRKELGSFYIEPALSLGYPYLFGVGVGLGVRF